MPFAQLADIRMHYEVHGHGSPVVLIAGLTGDIPSWMTFTAALAKHYQVIVIDNRGVGQSDCPDYPYTVDMMADDVAQLCEHMGVKQAMFVGTSMGGAIVQTLCRRYPNLVKAAVLSCTFNKINANFRVHIDTRLALREHGIPKALDVKIDIPWGFSDDYLNKAGALEEIVAENLANPHPITTTGFRHQWHACKTFDSSDWLSTVNTPCLVLSGDRDLIAPEREAKALAKQLSNAEYHCFQGIGHIPHMEVPDAFIDVVKQFLIKRV